MIIVEDDVKLFHHSADERMLERIGRECWKSEDRITEDSYIPFLTARLRDGHKSFFEHITMTFHITTDRGVSHELVRHRMASYTQQSTRYCNYSGGKMQFVRPAWCERIPLGEFGFEQLNDPLRANLINDDRWSLQEHMWLHQMLSVESLYNTIIKSGWKPEQARSILPNSLATTVFMTMNFSSLLNFLKLRTAKSAHPQMQVVGNKIKAICQSVYPVVFADEFIKEKK